MLSNETVKLELNLRKNLLGFLRNSFISKSLEENEGGVEVMGNILQINQVLIYYLNFQNISSLINYNMICIDLIGVRILNQR